MPSLPKKIIVSLLILLQLFLLSSSFGASAAKAASIGPWYNQTPAQYYSKVYEGGNPSEIFGERYTTAQVDWIIMSVLAWPFAKLFGGDMVVCASQGLSGTLNFGECMSALFDTSLTPAQEGLALANTGPEEQSLVAGILSDRPISAITYVKDIFRKPQIVPEAEAQGFGYDVALDPVKGMWASVRNFTYFFFVIITIVFAFMIMFRVKLSPQTVITVQSALPKIFIAMILVTFSYAIAGLLIDLMYVVIGILSILLDLLFGENFPLKPGGIYNGMTADGGIVALIIFYSVALPLSVAMVIVSIFGAVITYIATTAFAVGAILIGAATGTIAWIIILLIIAVLVIWLLYLVLKIIWTLIKAYAMIVLLTIFAPLHIALGLVVPSLGFSRWLKSYVSQLAVFVVVGSLFMLAFVFLVRAVGASLDTFPDDAGFIEFVGYVLGGTGTISFIKFNVTGDLPESVGSWPPLLGYGGSTAISFLFLATSFVIFTMIPKAADLIKSAVSGQPFSYGAAIGEAFGPAAGAGRLAGRAVTGAVQTWGEERVGEMGTEVAGRFRRPAAGEGEAPPEKPQAGA